MLVITDSGSMKDLSPEDENSIQELHALARELGVEVNIPPVFIGIVQELGRWWNILYFTGELNPNGNMLFRMARLNPDRFTVTETLMREMEWKKK